MKYLFKKNDGFTLVELVVTIAVTAIFFAIISSLIFSINRNFQKTEEINTTNNEVARAYDLINTIMDSYNEAGTALTYDSVNKNVLINGTASTIFSMQEVDGNLLLTYELGGNTNTVVFTQISSIGIDRRNDLLIFTIEDKMERQRQLFVQAVGGIQ